MMNLASKMLNFAFQMMNLESKMLNFAFQMMNLASKMLNFCISNDESGIKNAEFLHFKWLISSP